MPNWCANTIELHASKEKLDEFEAFLNEKDGKNWFDFFVEPVSEDNEDWYQHNLDTYGCKWNCDAQDWSRNESSISFWFDSPWAPPTNLYERITENGHFQVDAQYHEEGMGFVGRFVDGEDEYYDYDFENADSFDEIPEELLENWSIRERHQEWLEENEEDNQ